MAECECDLFSYGDRVSSEKKCWKPFKEGKMGMVMKCDFCGCLWYKTIGGHGEIVYIKSKEDEDFGKPSPSTSIEIDVSQWNENLLMEWNKIIRALPQQDTQNINGRTVPEDIMSFLYFIFRGDIREIKKWINCPIFIEGNLVTPIMVLDREEGVDILRYYVFYEYKMKQKYEN